MEEIGQERQIEDATFRLVDVPTQYGKVVRTPEGRDLSLDEAIVESLNLLHQIKKSLG